MPSDVLVSRAEPGLLELTPVDDNWGSSLVILTADGSLERLLNSYRDDGLITMVPMSAPVGGGVARGFEIRPTNAGQAADCNPDPSCLPIGATFVDVAHTNLAHQIDGPSGRSVWTLYRADNLQAPFLRTTNEILESIEFADE